MADERNAATITRELGEVAVAIDKTEERLAALRQRRVDLWLEGRNLTPPITNGDLGRAAKVSEELVLKLLRKERAKS